MTEKTEALLLAAELERGSYDAQMARTMVRAAAKLRRLSAVEAQRDALLEALKLARPYISTYTLDGYHAEVKADAAIKAVEENT